MSADQGQFDTLRRTLLAVALVGALVVRLVWALPLGVTLLIFFVGWPLGGTLITLDDDLPDGWSNPDGDQRPLWLEMPFWGQIVLGLALSLAGFAIDAGWRSVLGWRLWLAAAVAGVVGATLSSRR